MSNYVHIVILLCWRSFRSVPARPTTSSSTKNVCIMILYYVSITALKISPVGGDRTPQWQSSRAWLTQRSCHAATDGDLILGIIINTCTINTSGYLGTSTQSVCALWIYQARYWIHTAVCIIILLSRLALLSVPRAMQAIKYLLSDSTVPRKRPPKPITGPSRNHHSARALRDIGSHNWGLRPSSFTGQHTYTALHAAVLSISYSR